MSYDVLKGSHLNNFDFLKTIQLLKADFFTLLTLTSDNSIECKNMKRYFSKFFNRSLIQTEV